MEGDIPLSVSANGLDLAQLNQPANADSFEVSFSPHLEVEVTTFHDALSHGRREDLSGFGLSRDPRRHRDSKAVEILASLVDLPSMDTHSNRMT